METEIFSLAGNASLAGAFIVFVIYVLKPLTEDYIKRKKNGRGYETHELQEKVKKLQENEVRHLQADLEEIRNIAHELKGEVGKLTQGFYQLKDRVLVVETKIKKDY